MQSSLFFFVDPLQFVTFLLLFLEIPSSIIPLILSFDDLTILLSDLSFEVPDLALQLLDPSSLAASNLISNIIKVLIAGLASRSVPHLLDLLKLLPHLNLV